MTKVVVQPDQTLSGATFAFGTSAFVRKEGTLDSSTVQAGATLKLMPHAVGHDLTVDGALTLHATVFGLSVGSGGTASVLAGSHLTDATVASGGEMFVNSGTASEVKLDFGASLEQFGGRTSDTVVHAGASLTVAGGTAMSASVRSGSELVVSGGDVRHARVDGGAQVELTGGAMAGVIRDGGTLFVFGSGANLSGLTARDGAEVVLVGGASETGLTLADGASLQSANVLTFTTSGAASFAAVGYQQGFDAGQDVVAYAGAKEAFMVSGGTLTLSSGAEDKAGSLRHATEIVLAGAGDEGSVLHFGSQVVAGGTTGFDRFRDASQIVAAGGTAHLTTLDAKSFQVLQSGGVADTTKGTGTIDDRGGTLADTTLTSDTLVLDAVSTAAFTNVSAGVGGRVVILGQSVSIAPGSLVLGSGAELIAFGGTSLTGATIDAGATVVSAAAGIFFNGDGAIDPTAAANTFSGADLHSETMRVWAGGSVSDTNVDDASVLVVSGGFVSATHVFNGGTLIVSGGTVEDTKVHARGLIEQTAGRSPAPSSRAAAWPCRPASPM